MSDAENHRSLDWVDRTRPQAAASERRTFSVGFPAMSPMGWPAQADPKQSYALPEGCRTTEASPFTVAIPLAAVCGR